MKKLHIATIVLFFVLLLIPIATFEWREGVISEIDNRMLTENPFAQQDLSYLDFAREVKNYVEDRIGLRSEMIRIYTRLNDKLFGEMVHPSYIYGQDGYVFFNQTGEGAECTEYHREFAAMVAKIQAYCEQRKIPFLFVFEPAKTTVLSDKLAKGVNYNNGWVDKFFALLDEYGVNYVNNTKLLEDKTAAGEVVFNQKYNAGHWNDLGAYYGMNQVLLALQSDFPALHINTPEDFTVTQKLNTSLMVSEFPIEEYEPIYTGRTEVLDITDTFHDEVSLHPQYRAFAYRQNPEQMASGAPRVLVFQGSYVNGMGYKFLANSFGEYIAVHDYQNVMNFEYYCNLFQPECVIFEVAEYTFSDTYFDLDGMKRVDLNPVLTEYEDLPQTEKSIDDITVTTARGEALTVETLSSLPQDTGYVYLIMNGITYDLPQLEDGIYSLTVRNEDYHADDITVVALDTALTGKTVYQ